MGKKNKDQKEDPVEVLGLRRSRRLQDLPPPPPPAEGDSTSTSCGRNGDALVGERDPDVNVGGGLGLAEGRSGPSSSSHDMGNLESSANAPELEAQAHPCILNEDILDMVFKLIVNHSGRSNRVILADIRNFRLVCPPWRNSMTRVYRQTRPVLHIWQLKEESWLYLEKPRTFTHFVDTMRASDMIPVQKYKLDRNLFRNDGHQVGEAFFRICGPGVVTLDMSIQPNDAGRIVELLQSNPLPPGWDMMKMQTLEFHVVDYEREADALIGRRGITDMIGLLLDAGKTLREFELSYTTKFYGPGPLITLEEHLGPVIGAGIPATVKKIVLNLEHIRINESVFNNLAAMGLTLESFEFHAPSLLELESGSLYKFLESQAGTLKRLRVGKSHGEVNLSGISVKFPPLGELVHLELSLVNVSVATESDFARSFPKLSRLEFGRVWGIDTALPLVSLLSTVETTAPSPSVQVLLLPNIYDEETILTQLNLNRIAQSFPSLAELHVRLFDDVHATLGEVIQYFENIVVLDIHFIYSEKDWNADSIFSGISEADCERINRNRDFGNTNLAEFQRRPASLLNLTKLKKLVVRRERRSRRVECFSLTDFCAHFVFLKMEGLRELQLPRGIWFSPGYEDLLRDKLIVFRRADGDQ